MTRRLLASLLFAVALGLAPGVPSASAETPCPSAPTLTCAPWWGVNSGARPTNLGGDLGKDEVQQLTVSATKGEVVYFDASNQAAFKEIIEVAEGGKKRGELKLVAILPYDAPASLLQSELQTKVFANRRALSVSGGPGDEKGAQPYLITFPAQAVKTLAASGEFPAFLEGEALSCEGAIEPSSCTGQATLEELAAGVATQNQIFLTAENRGDAPTTGAVDIKDQLPPGFTPVAIEAHAGGAVSYERHEPQCSLSAPSCTFAPPRCSSEVTEQVLCELPPFEQIEVRISVLPGATGENTATASGGGASTVSAGHQIEVGGPQRFGFEDYELLPEKEGGALDAQAGSHPFQLTSVVTFNSQTPDSRGRPRAAGMAKDVVAELPPGLIGNPTPFAQCTDAQFATGVSPKERSGEGEVVTNECEAKTAIGVATVTFTEPNILGFRSDTVPIFNMVPRPGEPARFGFKAEGLVSSFLDTSLRTGGDYGVTVSALDIPQTASVLGVKLTFWGVPGASEHDLQRGWDCLLEVGGSVGCPASNPASPPPFLVMPTSCAEPFRSAIHGEAWTSEGRPAEVAPERSYGLEEGGLQKSLVGCNHLPFRPSIKVSPDGTAASSPTGLNVDVHVPQEGVLNAESRAESAVKGIEVVLPEGVAVNPSGGDGLQACSEGLAGFTGFDSAQPETATFTATPKPPFETPEPGLNTCANASKIGEVTIKSPLLPAGQFVKGFVYLATQNANPFGSLIALYIIASDPISGTLVKLTGETRLTPSGQIVTKFEDNPQLAFEDAEIHFFGGERAPLATPARCGSYTTTASFTPWSGNEGVSASAEPFSITSGPNGTPCPGASLPFSPSLTAGPTNINAGSFSPLTTTIGRADGQQDMQSVVLHMPPGLSGILTGVKLCPEQNANEGTCGEESLIGETTVSAGVGSDPVTVKGGKVYLTEKYAGAPFGLSIVNPVKAGPFDLEHDTSNPAQQPACDCVVVRAKVEVDPHTAALTITTDSSGPHAIPHLIDGIPVQIQKVNVLINHRANFTFNPTSCNPMSITGAIASAEGASSPVSVPFQVTNCAALGFAPKFAVSTSGRTSKANGASLSVRLSYPQAPFGSQANIKQVKVDLPKQLPSRLTTLQKACTAAQFRANPAGCPAASVVGHAKAITPLLPVPLEGLAYFVSNGGEAFPNLIMVLQGYGITIDLVGDTFINKAGITSSTFKTVPDQPVTSFELTLPEGPYSALTANTKLCSLTHTVLVKKRVTIKVKGHRRSVTRKVKQRLPAALQMPTAFTAQNGGEIRQTTQIAVTGCGKAKGKRTSHKRRRP